MQPSPPTDMQQVLQGFVQPWYESLANPAAAQAAVLKRLVQGHARTHYGQEHGAQNVTSLEGSAAAFPSSPTRTSSR